MRPGSLDLGRRLLFRVGVAMVVPKWGRASGEWWGVRVDRAGLVGLCGCRWGVFVRCGGGGGR